MRVEDFHEFVVLARCLNFSKAAAELFITQPALSNHIASMESELGFDLVIRGKPLALTPAGGKFYREAEWMLSHYEKTVAECRDLSRGEPVRLVIERPVETSDVIFMYETAVVGFMKENPAVSVAQTVSEGHALFDLLADGSADTGVVFDPCIIEDDPSMRDDFGYECIPGEAEYDRCLWVHESHPLASRDVITIQDLDGCRMFVAADARWDAFRACVRALCERWGIALEIVRHAGSHMEALLSVCDDEVVWLCEADTRKPQYAHVENRVFKKMSVDGKTFSPAFVYSKKNDNPALRMLLAHLRGQAAASPDGLRGRGR